MGKPFELDNQVQIENTEQNTQDVEMPIGANEIAKAKDTLKSVSCWCGWWDLNPHVVANMRF